MGLPKQCSSCGGCCGKGGCKQKNVYPHDYVAKHMRDAESGLRESVSKGHLKGERAKQALADADALKSIRLRWA